MKNKIIKSGCVLLMVVVVLAVSVLPSLAAVEYREPELVAYLTNRAQKEGGALWEFVEPSTSYYQLICLEPNTAYTINKTSVIVTDENGFIPVGEWFVAWDITLYFDSQMDDGYFLSYIDDEIWDNFGPGRSNNIGVYRYYGEVGEYANGYEDGVEVGYDNGYKAGVEDSALGQGLFTPSQVEEIAAQAKQQGIIEGRVGYITEEESAQNVSDAYSRGKASTEQGELTENFLTIISEIAFAPYRAVSTMFDFEILGINLAGFFFQLFTIAIAFLVISLILKYIF